ncbi:hypothetical protein MMC11_008709 [Xylographa trunciseda]|nr:hypothetical protein [Xylographa trunciseda]
MKHLYPANVGVGRLKLLADSMTTLSADFKQSNEARIVNELSQVMGRLNSAIQSNFKTTPKMPVFKNYRKGPANAQTDSNPVLSGDFATLAGEYGMAVLQINAGQGADFSNKIFDLYNKNSKDKQPFLGIDPVTQARFWQETASEKPYAELRLDIQWFGVYGGRSGSIDLAAFCGAHCFFRDEPWLRYAWANPDALTSLGTLGRTKDLDGQIPRCYRSMGLYPIVAIGHPKPISIDNKLVQQWQAIGDELGQWLGGKVTKGSLYPAAPQQKGWVSTTTVGDYVDHFLRRVEVGFVPTALTDAKYLL